MSSDNPTDRTVGTATETTAPGVACPECDGPLSTEATETRCADCGLVVSEDLLDRGPEWRWFDDGTGERERTGAPLTPTRHDRGLSAEIGNGPFAPDRKRRQLDRLRREHNRARFRTKAERNLAEAFGEIARMASALDLPRSARERAAVIHRDAQQRGLLVGRSIEALATASLYAACRCGRLTRSLDEVASVARCPRAQVERSYRLLNRELELAARLSRPDAFIQRLAFEVDAPDNVRCRAFDLVSRAEAAGIANGRHPGGVAAACVYRAGHEHGQLYTQAELAGVVDVTATTIRARLDDLRELVD